MNGVAGRSRLGGAAVMTGAGLLTGAARLALKVGVTVETGRSTCVDVDVVVDGPVANADPAVIGPASTLSPIAACTMRRTSIGLVRAAIPAQPRPTAPGNVLATSSSAVMHNQPRPTHAAEAAELPSS